MNKHIEKYGIWLVIFLRVIYVVPSSVLNYTFGFTKISTNSYICGSAFGFIPVVLLNVWAGKTLSSNLKSGFEINIQVLTIIFLSFLVILGLKLFYNKLTRY
jgi:uncharacterized membrane protein YdjX (TVP38/TMEM64 family)